MKQEQYQPDPVKYKEAKKKYKIYFGLSAGGFGAALLGVSTASLASFLIDPPKKPDIYTQCEERVQTLSYLKTAKTNLREKPEFSFTTPKVQEYFNLTYSPEKDSVLERAITSVKDSISSIKHKHPEINDHSNKIKEHNTKTERILLGGGGFGLFSLLLGVFGFIKTVKWDQRQGLYNPKQTSDDR